MTEFILQPKQPEADTLPYLAAYQQFKEDAGFEITYSEHVVVSTRYRFAGTLDRAGYLRLGKFPDELHLIDIKCVVTVSPATALQTALYALALEEQTGLAVTKRAALQLKENGKYKLHYFEDADDTANALAAVRMTNWRLAHGLATLEG